MPCAASSTACVSVLSGTSLAGILLRTNSRNPSRPMPEVTSFMMVSEIPHLPRGSACIVTCDRPAWPLAGRPHGVAAGHLGPGQATNIFAKGSCGTNKKRCTLSHAGMLRARQLDTGTGPGLGSLSASAPKPQRCHLSLGTDFSKAQPQPHHRLKFSSSQREPFVV